MSIQFSGRGEVYSFTTIYDAPNGFELLAPYVVALIKLENGSLVTAQLTDVSGDITIGMPVEAVMRKLSERNGEIEYGQKFRPVGVILAPTVVRELANLSE